MTSHNYSLMQMPTSLLAAGILHVALQIISKVEMKVDTEKLME